MGVYQELLKNSDFNLMSIRVNNLAQIMIERPKIVRSFQDVLRARILRERMQKKNETEEKKTKLVHKRQKWLKKEQKKKQDVEALEETKEQIRVLEKNLTNLKKEKDELFVKLKKVYEDDSQSQPKEVNQNVGHIYQYTQWPNPQLDNSASNSAKSPI